MAALVIVLLTACSSGSKVSIDDPLFGGIPRDIAGEVLASKVVAERLEGDNEAAKKLHLQGIALNFVLCRQAFEAYRAWLTTGANPSLPAAVPVEYPIKEAYEQYERDRRAFSEELESGDIETLRSHLLNESGCGVWIPAKLGDQTGPTIAEVIREP